ncbi:unnamed protein product, partial [Urochloa humidicola]
MIGFTLFFSILFTLALIFLEPYGKSHPSISEEVLKDKYANLNGDVLADKLVVSGRTTHQAAVSNPVSDSEIDPEDSD